jgi:hypothetical protein
MSVDNGLLINRAEEQKDSKRNTSTGSRYRGPKLKEHPAVKMARIFGAASLLASQAACIEIKNPIFTSERPATTEVVPPLEKTLIPTNTITVEFSYLRRNG